MVATSEGLIRGALKQVVCPRAKDSWDLVVDIDGEAAKDLRNFIQSDVTAGHRSINGVEVFLGQQIASLIHERIAKKSEGLDEYQSFVIEREGRASLDYVDRMAKVIHNFIFPLAN